MKTVTVRELVRGDGIPKICVPVIAHTYAELVHVLEGLEGACFDLVEFRADFYFDEDAPGGRPWFILSNPIAANDICLMLLAHLIRRAASRAA